MIYPDARLEGGEEWIEAHVPVDIPSTIEADERLRWFQFTVTRARSGFMSW
jgi:hypothetical protein